MSFATFVIFGLISICSLIHAYTININFHSQLNNRPIIGVLAQHFHPDNPFPPTIPGDSYISASYVKYLESAGARVVPIEINQDPEVIKKLLSSVNGVLFPGGDAYVMDSPYQKNAKLVYEYAIHEKDMNGNTFPVWGTCLGFQQLHCLVAGTDSVLSNSSKTWDVTKSLPDLDRTGRMTRDMPYDLFQAAILEPLGYHAHRNCVSVDAYMNNEKLKNFFKILSTNEDSDGKGFVSTVEGKTFQK